MANEEKLRSELRNHIENEMKKANSEDELTQDEIVKSSLFENELRKYLKSPASMYESSIEAAIATALERAPENNFWEGFPSQKISNEVNSESSIEER
jgi:hypothetical protein